MDSVEIHTLLKNQLDENTKLEKKKCVMQHLS